jgi:hypothetical protein
MTDLPFHDGHEVTATRNGAQGMKRCARHSWRPSPFEGESIVCWKCGKPKDAAVVRRNRANSARGKRAELDVARSIPGARKMGPLGLSWDVEVGTYARLQVKKLAHRPGPAEIARLIERIPDTGDRLRGFVWVEAAGQGKRGQRLIWFLRAEFTGWHGFPERFTMQPGLVCMTLDEWASEFIA